MTIELTLLGLQSVHGADGGELGALAAQPKRFALLAYLALAGGGGFHRRDALTAVFWPELDQSAARRALRNTLYHLREAIGDGVLITVGDDAVGIESAALTCDATRLAAAVAERRFEDAVELYRGELLAGVHFANAGEAFEEWLSRERARLVGLVLQALDALVDRDATAGRYGPAIRWAQRACALAPDDEGRLRRSMTLFDAAGDRASALRLYDGYERRLATDFDSMPTAETATLAARIRAGERQPPAPEPRRLDEARPVTPPPAAPAAPRPPTPTPTPTPDRQSWRWAGALLAAVIAIGLTGGTLASRRHASLPVQTRVLVDAFENRTGDPRLASLGRMAQDWLTQGLVRAQLVDVVDRRAALAQGQSAAGPSVDGLVTARRTGASLLVSGDFYRTGDTILFQGGVTEVASGRILRAVGPISAAARSPVVALDELRSRLMSALASVVDAHAPDDVADWGAVPRFEAYQAYLDASDAWVRNDARQAESLFLTAARLDTGFTAAMVALAGVAANTGDCALVDSIAAALDAPSRHLDRIERLSTAIELAHCHGRRDEALRLTLARAELEPRTSSFRMAAVAAALWADRPERALQLLREIDPRSDLSWSTDSTRFVYWSGYTEALHMLGRHDEELAITDELPAAAPLMRCWLRGRALAALSRSAEVVALVDTALTLPPEPEIDLGLAPFTNGRPQYSATPAWVAIDLARILAAHGNAAAARRVAERALAWYRARSAAERSTYEERLVAAMSLDMAGARAESERDLRVLAREDPANLDYRGLIGGLAAEQGDAALADSTDRWLAARRGDDVDWIASYYRARNDALLGRLADARARLRDAIDQGAWPMYLDGDPALARLRPAR